MLVEPPDPEAFAVAPVEVGADPVLGGALCRDQSRAAVGAAFLATGATSGDHPAAGTLELALASDHHAPKLESGERSGIRGRPHSGFALVELDLGEEPLDLLDPAATEPVAHHVDGTRGLDRVQPRPLHLDQVIVAPQQGGIGGAGDDDDVGAFRTDLGPPR